ncbi:hypothetical protein EW146_g3030 [Bondarzewia mesenterica]|uniref:N(6)-L-threonylcarbamoyladenine synthase n=1 Tax=Bondarzewia mesenterica TaxID=1095465 RepID=A0A4S4M0Q1_9AGAM|nr:hypothetical protein EW146_g3030 [Bondarzewia mesenterica]
MTGCLGVGASAAKNIAAALNKPLVGVHHMQAHALTALLTSPPADLPSFPFLTLLVSGGHTLLLLATSLTSFRILATTPDESIGRVFDKVSRMLTLPWSSLGPGAALEEFCLPVADEPTHGPDTDELVPPLPIAMPGTLAFSFSGLHSSVERFMTSHGGSEALDVGTKRALARAFQRAAVGQLEDKVALALKWCARKGFDNASPDLPMSLVFPPPSLCTDNAVMIGWASMHRFLAGDFDEYSIATRPKWSIEELSS